MRADSGIIYIDEINILLYLYAASSNNQPARIIKTHVLKVEYTNKENIKVISTKTFEIILDIISGNYAASVYNWKLIAKPENKYLLDELNTILHIDYEIPGQLREAELLCKGSISGL